MGGERRRDLIYQLIGEGYVAEQIDQKLEEELEIPVEKQINRGEQSEFEAKERLEKLPYVSNTHRYKQNTKSDRKKRDLKVNFNEEGLKEVLGKDPSINYVYIQVKSGHRRIKSSRSKLGNTEEEINEELAKRKIIVLSGTARQFDFFGEFIKQLKFINSFHQKDE